MSKLAKIVNGKLVQVEGFDLRGSDIKKVCLNSSKVNTVTKLSEVVLDLNLTEIEL